MKLFSRGSGTGGGAAAVLDASPPAEAEAPPAPRFDGSDAELAAEIARLRATGGADAARQRRLLELRHVAGVRALEAAQGTHPDHPTPDESALPAWNGALPEIPAAQLTPELLRAGILRDGCLLVRGLIPREDAAAFADEIDALFAERAAHDEGRHVSDGRYEEFVLHPPFDPFLGRPWIKMGGGVYAADSPRLSAQLVELFDAARIPQLASAYLGEPALMSVHKTTLRKAEPSVPGTWHQDGKFMGEVRALNLWLSLSRCGDVSPGLDVVPRRLNGHVTTNTDEAVLDTQVSNAKAAEAAGDRGILRPIFEPGDALLFDELFLHQTASDPSMPNPRYAIECWFFGGSAFPAAYAPIAL